MFSYCLFRCDPQIASGVNRSDNADVMQDNYNYFTQSKKNYYVPIPINFCPTDNLIERNFSTIVSIDNGCLEKVISSHVEVSKIGRQIAEEVLDLQRRCEDSFSGNSPGPGTEPVLSNAKVIVVFYFHCFFFIQREKQEKLKKTVHQFFYADRESYIAEKNPWNDSTGDKKRHHLQQFVVNVQSNVRRTTEQHREWPRS